jgi:hypothetical protein
MSSMIKMMVVAGGKLSAWMVRTTFYIDAAGGQEGAAEIEEGGGCSSVVVGKAPRSS